MPSTTVYNQAGEAVEQLELSEQVFGITPNMAVLHQVVTAQLVNRRQGNASTKTRAEVSGGNKKPYKQKGTGNARQGSTRAPQFRHGGVVWGPKPHPYHHDVPKKVRRLAIRSVLSDKVATESLIVVDNLSLEQPRTKDMLEILSNLPTSAEKRVLMMMPRRDENIVLSTRNIPTAKVQHVSSINVVELLKHDYVIMPVETVRWLEMVFGEGLSAEEATQRIAEESTEVDETEESTEVDETEESTEVGETEESTEVDETEESSEAGETEESTEVDETEESPEASDGIEPTEHE
jgi:large subunit ribosomal protein L4